MKADMITARFLPNPFYEGAGVWVLTDSKTQRRQHMAIWPPMSRTDFLRLARHHLREITRPLPISERQPAFRLFPTRRDDDDLMWS